MTVSLERENRESSKGQQGSKYTIRTSGVGSRTARAVSSESKRKSREGGTRSYPARDLRSSRAQRRVPVQGGGTDGTSRRSGAGRARRGRAPRRESSREDRSEGGGSHEAAEDGLHTAEVHARAKTEIKLLCSWSRRPPGSARWSSSAMSAAARTASAPPSSSLPRRVRSMPVRPAHAPPEQLRDLLAPVVRYVLSVRSPRPPRLLSRAGLRPAQPALSPPHREPARRVLCAHHVLDRAALPPRMGYVVVGPDPADEQVLLSRRTSTA